MATKVAHADHQQHGGRGTFAGKADWSEVLGYLKSETGKNLRRKVMNRDLMVINSRNASAFRIQEMSDLMVGQLMDKVWPITTPEEAKAYLEEKKLLTDPVRFMLQAEVEQMRKTW